MTYLSVKEAAKIAGKNERTIRRWIKANKIKTTQIRGRFHVDSESLDELIGTRKEARKKNQEDGKEKENITKAKSSSKQKENNDSTEDRDLTKMSDKMSGEGEDNRLENVRTVDLVGEKIREYVRFLEIQNEELMGKKLSKHVQTIPNFPNHSKHEKHMETIGMNAENKVIEEGEEYVLGQNVRTKKMSVNDTNNMSVKKLSYSPIVSQVKDNNAVEMSDFINSTMSVSRKFNADIDISPIGAGHVSDFINGLSTKSDIPVDKFFDVRDTIDVENLFSDDTVKMSEHNLGHFDRTNPVSVNNVRQNLSENFLEKDKQNVVNISAYATRLIDEKERVAKKFEEQNDFLKNELSELRKEVSALRGVVASETKNRANTSEFLMRENESWRKKTFELMERVEVLNKDNYELQITNYKLDNRQNPESDISNYSAPKVYPPMTENFTNNSKQYMENIITRGGEEVNNNEISKDTQVTQDWMETKCPDIYERQKLFLIGMGLGMIFGLGCVSLILFLILNMAS